jgi:hypothetical protein
MFLGIHGESKELNTRYDGSVRNSIEVKVFQRGSHHRLIFSKYIIVINTFIINKTKHNRCLKIEIKRNASPMVCQSYYIFLLLDRKILRRSYMLKSTTQPTILRTVSQKRSLLSIRNGAFSGFRLCREVNPQKLWMQ